MLAVPCTLFPCEVMKSCGKLRPQSTSPIGGLHTPNMEVTTTIHFPHWWSTHTKYGSYDHNTLPLLVVYTHQIWKLRPQLSSPIGGLHTPNMEVTTTLPPLVVYTHQIWKKALLTMTHIPFTWYVTHTLPLQAYCHYTLAD